MANAEIFRKPAKEAQALQGQVNFKRERRVDYAVNVGGSAEAKAVLHANHRAD